MGKPLGNPLTKPKAKVYGHPKLSSGENSNGAIYLETQYGQYKGKCGFNGYIDGNVNSIFANPNKSKWSISGDQHQTADK
jgi:hypothetical protein